MAVVNAEESLGGLATLLTPLLFCKARCPNGTGICIKAAADAGRAVIDLLSEFAGKAGKCEGERKERQADTFF